MHILKAILVVCPLLSFDCFSQFTGPVGTLDCDALYKDSNSIDSWATTCEIVLGKENISNSLSPLVSFGSETNAVGFADNQPVSLGDGGEAVLTFAGGIQNGSGPDFVVFENSFSNFFLELAFVEASSNGIDFIRFPCVSNTPNSSQIGAFDNSGDATKLHNLAGKHRANYGTPFDLQDLIDSVGLDINAITHIKIIDVVGQINGFHTSFDKNNNAINDPFPTEFETGGFDLDAVGVINSVSAVLHFPVVSNFFYLSNGFIHVKTNSDFVTIRLINTQGQVVFKANNPEPIALDALNSGVYFIQLETSQQLQTLKFSW